MRPLVFREREGRWLVRLHAMAAVARVEIRSRSKLLRVAIAMAIGAAIELHFENRVAAFRNVALRALQTRVTTLQRILGQSVLFHRKSRRFPPLHSVAGRTFSAIGALRKLTFVRIGLMAVHALGKSQGLLEISIGMALRASDAGVLPFQGKFCFGMIEAFIYRVQRNLFPSAGVVAGLATLREAAMMRIFVAVRALVKRNP